MQIIPQSEINIEKIVEELKAGKTIVYPTETCYGLGCDATNSEAVEKIFAIKKRQRDKSVLVVVPDESYMLDYVEWTPKIEELSDKYWPGPLTIVASLKRDADLPQGIVAEDNTIAFRVTNHHLAAELSEKLGAPLVSTSANISAKESPYSIESVLEMFNGEDNQPDIIIDAGELPHKAASTIVRVVGEEVEVLRQGELIIE